eukprot:768546-Hanusia_phi.AAC.3
MWVAEPRKKGGHLTSPPVVHNVHKKTRREQEHQGCVYFTQQAHRLPLCAVGHLVSFSYADVVQNICKEKRDNKNNQGCAYFTQQARSIYLIGGPCCFLLSPFLVLPTLPDSLPLHFGLVVF